MRTLAYLALAALTTGAFAQEVTKQPRPKSKAEAEAVMAIFNAQDPDSRIAAVDALLVKFADTEFKAVALQIATGSAEEKNDFDRVVIYGERTLEADPNNYAAMLSLARGYATRTREFDLDKEEKLGKAEKYAQGALEAIKTAVKPRADITDEQWNGAKKDFSAEAYSALGIAATVRKKYDDAIAHFKTSLETAATPDSVTKVRLATAYNSAGKFDEALAILDPLLAEQDLNPTVRQFAAQEKLKAATGKAQKK